MIYISAEYIVYFGLESFLLNLIEKCFCIFTLSNLDVFQRLGKEEKIWQNLWVSDWYLK